jgi:muramidase (phage lysozyme)
MPLNPFATSIGGGGGDDDDSTSRRRKRAQSMGAMLMQASQAPVASPLQGFGQVAVGALGGYLRGKEDAESEKLRKQLADAVLVASGVNGPAVAPTSSAGAPASMATPSTPLKGFNTSGKLPAFASMPVAQDLQPHQTALLNAIAAPESGGRYDIRYTPKGGATFADTSQHPAIFEPGPAGPSSAAGRYQFTKTTWDRMGGGAFDPENQDRRALKLAQDDYARRTGRNLDSDLQANGFTPQIAAALAPTWAGFKDNPSKAAAAYQSTLSKVGTGGQRTADASALNAPASAPSGYTGEFDNAQIPMVPVTGDPGTMVAIPPARPQFADLPTAGAIPTGMDPMGNQTGTPDDEPGFFIPPAPAGPAVPSLADLAPLSNADQFKRVGLDPATTTYGGTTVPLPPDASPAIAQSLAGLASPPVEDSVPLAVTVRGGSGVEAPLPPSRPADLGAPVEPRQALARAVAAPLPPSRPADLGYDPRADMPALNAQAVAMARAVMAGGPDLSNSDSAGARQFTASQADPQALAAALANYAPGQGGTSGSPDRTALAQAVLASGPPLPQPSASASGFTPQQLARGVDPSIPAPPPVAPQVEASPAPQAVIPPGSAGGPVPGPNGPVAPPVASTADPRRAALVAIMTNPEASPQQQMWAMSQLNPKTEHVDLGDSIGIIGPSGKLVGSIAKTKIPTYGVIGKDQYGNESYGFIDPSNMRTVPGQAAASTGSAVLPGQPGSAIPAPPPGVDPKVWLKQQSEAAASNALPVDPKQVAEVRKEVLGIPSYKNLKQAAPVYRAMSATAATDSKASDLNLIYGLGKIMDPGSVVREGEMALAQGTAGIDDRLAGLAKSVFGGARLQPETRAALMAEAHGRMKSYEDEFDVDAQHYRGIAKRGRMNEEDVVPTFERSKPWQAPAKPNAAPAPANDGWTDVGGVKIRKKN